MRYARIFLFHFQDILQDRSRALVWFLVAIINPLVAIIFWRGATLDPAASNSSVSISQISSYYFYLLFASSLLLAHIETDVGYYDIQEGRLTSYLLKPFSYLQMKFYTEFSYRLVQGFYGIIVFILLRSLIGSFVTFVRTPQAITLIILIGLLAFCLSFLFKMIIGISALWLVDFRGFQQFSDVVVWLLSGLIVPITFFPSQIQLVAHVLPFSYMLYHPILAFQGLYDVNRLVGIALTQIIWIALLFGIYKILWMRGIKKYTGVGL